MIMCKILYVEDNPMNAMLVRAILKKERPDVELTICETGASTMVQLHKEKPDFLLIDVQLPDMNALDLLKKIREDTAFRSIPAAATSAALPSGEITRLLDAGFRQFLVKPINKSQLLALLPHSARQH